MKYRITVEFGSSRGNGAVGTSRFTIDKPTALEAVNEAYKQTLADFPEVLIKGATWIDENNKEGNV